MHLFICMHSPRAINSIYCLYISSCMNTEGNWNGNKNPFFDEDAFLLLCPLFIVCKYNSLLLRMVKLS